MEVVSGEGRVHGGGECNFARLERCPAEHVEYEKEHVNTGEFLGSSDQLKCHRDPG